MTQNVSYSNFFDEAVEVQRKQILNIKFKGGSDDSFQSILKHFLFQRRAPLWKGKIE